MQLDDGHGGVGHGDPLGARGVRVVGRRPVQVEEGRVVGQVKGLDDDAVADVEPVAEGDGRVPPVDAVAHLLLPLLQGDGCVGGRGPLVEDCSHLGLHLAVLEEVQADKLGTRDL